MKKIETFIPEEGDKLVVVQDLPELNLSKGDIVIFVNSISMGVVCLNITEREQMIVPFNALKAIEDYRTVDLTFQ